MPVSLQLFIEFAEGLATRYKMSKVRMNDQGVLRVPGLGGVRTCMVLQLVFVQGCTRYNSQVLVHQEFPIPCTFLDMSGCNVKVSVPKTLLNNLHQPTLSDPHEVMVQK